MIQIEALLEGFEQQFGKSEKQEYYFSPGRVNIIGDHIDYNGGNVLPFALNIGITAIFAPDQSDELIIANLDFNEIVEVNFNHLKENENHREQLTISSLKQVLKRNLNLRGGKVILKSDLPIGAGLSSSAAFACLILYMMQPEYYDKNRLQLALDAQTAEIEGLGVQCGIMDQYTIAFAKKNHAMLIDCQSLKHEQIPLKLSEYQFVIINSNFSRHLSDSKYNERRTECQQALAAIQRFDPAEYLADAHQISIGYIEDDTLYARAKHVLTEQQRVLAATDAISLGNMEYLGKLMNMSHVSLDEDFEVSNYALNCIHHYAHHFRQCLGSRMTGAGFGGCVIALVEKDAIKRFITYIGKKYREDQDKEASFYLVESSDGVQRI